MDNSFVVKIKNYQIIRDAKLEFVPGLNCIVGQSNNGKSAVLRAIETALFNIPRANHVTQGETVSAVGIQYRGNTLIWRRDTKATSQVSYKWNGQVLTKVGRGQPEFVSQALGIREMELDATMMRLNFQKQMAYPFLLDKTPSQLFKFIVQSAEEDNLMDVVDAMKKDLNQIAFSIKGNERAQEEVGKSFANEKQKYASLKEVVPVCDSILGSEPRIKSYLRMSEMSDSLKGNNDDIKTIKVSLSECKDTIDYISPRYESAMRNIATLERLTTLVNSLNSKKDSKEEVTNQIKSVESSLSKLEGLEEIKGIFTAFGERRELLDSMVYVVGRYNSTVSSLNTIKKTLEGISSREKFLEVLPQVLDYLRKTEGLISIARELKLKEISKKDILMQVSLKTEELKQLVRELEDKFPVCPYCGSSLKDSQVTHVH